MEETISLKEIFQTLKQRWKLLVAIPLLAMLAGTLVSVFVLTPKYERSAELLIYQAGTEEGVTQNDVRTSLELVGTYTQIIKSPRILNDVIENGNLDYSLSTLQNMVSVTNQNNSQVLLVTVEADKPEEATAIVNEISTVFEAQIPDILSTDNVTILSEAVVGENPSPSSPNTILNMAIAFVVGLMGAVGLAFLLEYLDTTVKSEKDIEKILNLPVLGVVSTMDAVEPARKSS
ncbi:MULTISPECIES: YveK family protein [Shouchella]|uniref:Wzz/FepE/Etk N-terminal domain-containing protein n=2 Tax=Shouchella TaxID=2893057 RepID=A0ABY7WBL0_9BACI|nr:MULTISPECIES: Wzz/FepE/Etk N-terminal domain-containing protein [Shouchella]MED4128343.1 Wzz/FepE/Etk N-terminal domain-containing protein [Shouchella miscanthi]WDF05024.1 Wzz/FepE/Etk N-terminal domain-containing protein [Shouchella hunanensis]GAF21557.1 tyrosine-protein kinase transmembrane modulator EpsC [Bacillus sp. JCM 19047]